MKSNVFNLSCIFPRNLWLVFSFKSFVGFFFQFWLLLSAESKKMRTMKKTFTQTKLKTPWFLSNLTLYRIRQLVTSLKSRGDHRKEGASNTLCLLSFCLPSLLENRSIRTRCAVFFFFQFAPRMNKTLPNCPFFHEFIVFEFTKCYGGHLIVKLIVCMINTFKSKCNNQWV